MIEPLVEGIGCIFGLVLLWYFQLWRPSREAARDRARLLESEPAPAETPETSSASSAATEPRP